MSLKKITLSKIEEIKKQKIKIDCFSWKIDNKPAGKATEDCDYAIDVFLEDQSNINFGQSSYVINPYNDLTSLVRLKFNV